MKQEVSKMTPDDMISWTIMALNGGSDEAMQCAMEIKEKAEASGDEELIKHINYLWDVI